jgi:hypothetical protein
MARLIFVCGSDLWIFSLVWCLVVSHNLLWFLEDVSLDCILWCFLTNKISPNFLWSASFEADGVQASAKARHTIVFGEVVDTGDSTWQERTPPTLQLWIFQLAARSTGALPPVSALQVIAANQGSSCFPTYPIHFLTGVGGPLKEKSKIGTHYRSWCENDPKKIADADSLENHIPLLKHWRMDDDLVDGW